MKKVRHISHLVGPFKGDLNVTCSHYYRQRADVQRALKGPPIHRISRTTNDLARQNANPLVGFRQLRGLSIEELAAQADLAVSEVQHIENGHLDAPIIAYIKLAKALRVDVGSIFPSTDADTL